MEDQMVFTGNGRGISRHQWSIKYSIKGDYRTIEMCVYFLPFPLPDFFPSFHTCIDFYF